MDIEDDRRIEFLKYAIDYLERRINLVDNKANILIAIQGGYFALIFWLARIIVGKWNPLANYTTTDILSLASFVFLILAFVKALVVTLYSRVATGGTKVILRASFIVLCGLIVGLVVIVIDKWRFLLGKQLQLLYLFGLVSLMLAFAFMIGTMRLQRLRREN